MIHENQILQSNEDPSESFLKHIQQTIHKCNTIRDKNQQKYLIQIKLVAPKLNILLKANKKDKPIRPLISNIQTKSYKLSKYPNKKLNQLIQITYTYATGNSKERAQYLNNTR